jgi:hypothetical protein
VRIVINLIINRVSLVYARMRLDLCYFTSSSGRRGVLTLAWNHRQILIERSRVYGKTSQGIEEEIGLLFDGCQLFREPCLFSFSGAHRILLLFYLLIEVI